MVIFGSQNKPLDIDARYNCYNSPWNEPSKTSFTIGVKNLKIKNTQKRSKLQTTKHNLLGRIFCKWEKIWKAVITKNDCITKKPKTNLYDLPVVIQVRYINTRSPWCWHSISQSLPLLVFDSHYPSKSKQK